MAGTGQDELETGRSIEIVGPEVPASGWQQIDLARTLGGLPGGGAISGRSTQMSAAASASVLAFPAATVCLSGTATHEPLKRVPNSAFVSIGWTPGSPVPRIPALRAKSRFANDNVSSGKERSVWRDLFFLAILAATVLGAFWSGRVQGLQKVIVVPEPSSIRHVVT